MSWEQALAWRLTRTGLGARTIGDGTAAGLVHQLSGLHAQYTAAAELAAGLRDERIPPTVVRSALVDERTLAKTWLMRGTLHLAASADLPTYVAALRPESFHQRPQWLRENKVSFEDMRTLIDLVPRILRGQCLTRAELAEQVGKAMPDETLATALRSGFGEVLKPVAFAGGLCFGPNQGRLITFMHPLDWLGGAWHEPSAEQAQATVLRDYLSAHGPASKADFARWWGMSKPTAQRVRDALGSEIVDLTVAGRPAWLLREDLAELLAHQESRTLRLLPAFDPYVVTAGRDVEDILSTVDRKKVYRFAGLFAPVVLVGGRMVGTWQHKSGRRRLQLTVDPFRRLTRTELGQLDSEANRLAALLGGQPEVVVSPVS